jgi:hypothetical protein
MKIKKGLSSAVFVILLIFAWGITIIGSLSKNAKYNNYIKLAEDSVDKQLYLQSIEYYEKAYEIKSKKKVYKEILASYDSYLEELQTEDGEIIDPAGAETKCLEFLEKAVSIYPEDSEYWTRLIELNIKEENYNNAYLYAKKGKSKGVSTEEFDKLYQQLYYMTEDEFQNNDGYKFCGNYYVFLSGTIYTVQDLTGTDVLSGYDYIAPVSANGYALVQNSEEAFVIDMKGIIRGRFGYLVEEAGCYSEESGLIPVKLEDKWYYVDLDGEKKFGKFDKAGNFINHKAAVKDGDVWYFIDEGGEKVSKDEYEDIKLNQAGDYLTDKIALLKSDGKYKIYNEKLEEVSDFECDDIDIYMGNEYIAYCEDEKWGFVDTKGKVVKEAEYKNAKSFSNGFAAISDDDGKWGFVNKKFEKAIDYIYLEAGYFDSAYRCMVSKEENRYYFIKFRNA